MPEENKTPFKMDFNRLSGRMLAALVFLSLAYNIMVCWRAYRTVPLLEGASRSLMAANSRFFYDSGLSEPIPVSALKIAMFLGAEPDAAIRAQGLAMFAAVTVLTVMLLRRRYGITAGLAAALFLAANPYMGYYAMLGDSHLYALFFLLLFWHYFEPAELTARRAALAGFWAGFACLSRLDSAWFILLATGLSAALNFRKYNFKAAGLSLCLALTLVVPYLSYQRAHYKNGFYAQELSLRRWADMDNARNKYAGSQAAGPLSVPEFVLRDGAGGALRRAFGALWRSLSYEVPKVVFYKLLIVLVFMGFYAAFIQKKNGLPVFFCAAFFPVLALAPAGESSLAAGISLRYYLLTLWSFCAIAGLGLQETLAWVEKQLDERLQAMAAATKKAEDKR